MKTIRFIRSVLSRIKHHHFFRSDPLPSDYEKRVAQEINTYSQVENVHDLPEIFHYWSNKYLLPKVQQFGFNNAEDFYLMYLKKVLQERQNEDLRFISIGSGNCDIETLLVKKLCESGINHFKFECLEINSHMIERGQKLAHEHGIAEKMIFTLSDIKEWTPEKYSVVIANQSLHHFQDLEILFEKIKSGLYPDGYFLTDDMIGRNGHQRWPEALDIVNTFWKLLPESHKFNHYTNHIEAEFINHDCSKESFEGIRAQDILPLLHQNFHFDLFVGFGNIIFPFIDRTFGHNYDAQNEWDRELIDRIHETDEQMIESGKIKPTQMIAAMTLHPVQQMKIYKHLSPEFCLRPPVS